MTDVSELHPSPSFLTNPLDDSSNQQLCWSAGSPQPAIAICSHLSGFVLQFNNGESKRRRVDCNLNTVVCPREWAQQRIFLCSCFYLSPIVSENIQVWLGYAAPYSISLFIKGQLTLCPTAQWKPLNSTPDRKERGTGEEKGEFLSQSCDLRQALYFFLFEHWILEMWNVCVGGVIHCILLLGCWKEQMK